MRFLTKRGVKMLKIRRGKQVIWQDSLADVTNQIRTLCREADAIVIGAGAGLSDSAGVSYTGARFTENFQDFIRKYGMTDMYTAGFYPFETEEEKWAYWSKHIRLNRFDTPVGEPYKKLLALVQGKEYFIITTNVDAQFYRAGFDSGRIWAVQGDYGRLQCARGCHDKLYDSEDLIMEMTRRQENCRIPSELVPRCPVCQGRMEVHIRRDMYFVQDEEWYREQRRYTGFLDENKDKNIVFWELGVGFNTPTIIRFPFEKMVKQMPQARLIRVNLSRPEIPPGIAQKGIGIRDDIEEVLYAIGL